VPFGLRRVSRTRSGTYRVRLPGPEREVLARLVGDLRQLLAAGAGAEDLADLARLFPPAYHEDAERDREYHALVRDELLDRRLAAIEVVESTVADASELDEDQLCAWMAAINDLRLVLGTRLGVTADTEPVGPDHPDAPALAAYEYLGFLLHEVVEALSGGLPPPVEGP
jgi:hypothetical protein